MNTKELKNFFNYLNLTWDIFGPKEVSLSKKDQHQVLIERLENFDDLVLDSRLPYFSFKRFFVPESEILFDYKNGELKESPQKGSRSMKGFHSASSLLKEQEEKFLLPFSKKGGRAVLLGLNLLDLKSILLYDQVFEKDPYYQARRQNILVIGHNLVPDLPQNIFEQTFEEDVLEHLSFDIFLAEIPASRSAAGSENRGKKLLPKLFVKSQDKQQPKNYAVFTGSLRGQQILKDFGYEDFIHIQFSGPVKEGKLDERMIKLRDKLKNKHNQKIWDELGKRCIECGKCTVACPTCFCFRIDDAAGLANSEGQRQRCWDSCYYQEFSEVAGGHKFLNSTAARIHFWYYHKFARIPDEFDFMGCIGCRRCAAVCPVGIDIGEVLKKIEES